MMTEMDEIKDKGSTTSIYSLKVLEINDLKVYSKSTGYDQNHDFSSVESTILSDIKTLCVSDKRLCLICNCNFNSRDQQIEHYKMDWHRFNLKRNLLQLPSLTEIEFQNLIEDRSDVSSISGSESDCSSSGEENSSILLPGEIVSKDTSHNSSPNARTSMKIAFVNSSNYLYKFHNCLFSSKIKSMQQHYLLPTIRKMSKNSKIAIILIGGGHFAAGIFEMDQLKLHKTFHRYTVRAKQGTSQGMRDKKNGNKIKSAGSALRRHNEQVLVADIQNLLSSWEDDLKMCSHVFYRAPSFNKSILFSNKLPPFKKDDERLRNIPFATRRATLREVKRIFDCLTSVEISLLENEDHAEEIQPASSPITATNDKDSQPVTVSKVDSTIKKSKKKKKKKKTDDLGSHEKDKDKPLLLPEIVETFDNFDQLYTLCKLGNYKELISFFKTVKSSTIATSFQELLNRKFGLKENTLLHLCSKSGFADIVKMLLYNDANPCIKNNSNQTPYVVAKDNGVRDVFIDFKLNNPDTFDYQAANIPDPKVKSTKKKKKPKSKKKPEEEDETLTKSDNPCTLCNKDLSKTVPFECYNLKFCSTECVKKFRTRQIR